MPKPTKFTPQSSSPEQEVLDALPKKKSKSASSKVTDVIELGATSSTTSPPDEQITQALADFRARLAALGKKADAEYTAKLVADGKPTYTADQVSKLFGISVPEDLSQEQLQGLVQYGNVLLPLKTLAKLAKGVMDKYVTPGRNAIRTLVAGAYRAYLLAETSEQSVEIYRSLRATLKAQDVTVHKDAPNASVIVRMVFADLTPKRVHLYSRALEYASQWGIEPDHFEQFIIDEGGFEVVRTSARKVNPNSLLERDDKQLAADLTKEWLEVEQSNPFLTVTMLTRDQRSRLTSADWREVLLVARVEYDTLKVYAQVPLTSELQRTIHAAVYKVAGEDAEELRKKIERCKLDAIDRKAKDPDPLYGYVPRASEEGMAEAHAARSSASSH